MSIIGLRADVTGSFLGVVKDTSSAVIPGAHVIATNVGTNMSKDAISGPDGQYSILALPVGRYKIEAQAQGFQTLLISDIVLDVNQERQVDLTLQVGQVEQHVNVSANTVAVDTVSTQLGQVVDERTLLNLPLNGRSYIDLLALQPGVVPGSVVTSGYAVSGQLAAGNLSVNGGRETANNFLVNGGAVNEGMFLGTAVIPNLDAVAEFRLITNSFDAEYGKFSGSVMNAITKSGTNQIHGDVFEFVRNDDMDSRSFFDPERAALKRNQFGYTAGGPAIKDKVFWFTDYQGTRQIQGAGGGLAVLPTAAERQGNFTPADFINNDGTPATVNGTYWAGLLSQRLGYTVTNGETYSTPACANTLNCVFPGGVIPTAAFDPVATATMKYIPLPNVGTDEFNQVGLGSTHLRDDKLGQRVDINNMKTGNWGIYYSFDDSSVVNPFGAASVPGFGTSTPTRAQLVTLSNTKIISPSAVNEARLSFMRNAAGSGQNLSAPVSFSSLGFVTGANTLGLNPSGRVENVPQMDFNQFSLGGSTYIGQDNNNVWSAAENLSKIWSRHSIKLGGDFRYHQLNMRGYNEPDGVFGFSGSETGIDFADYLLGAPANFSQSSTQALDSRSIYYGVYAQDSFHMRPSLTLNYGLRWEVSSPWYDTQNRIQAIVPGEQSVVFPTSPLGWVFPGDPGVARTLAPTRYNNFAPRIGLAYSPQASGGILGKLVGGPGKTSIRAFYGVFYSSIEDLVLGYEIGDAPFGQYWNNTAPDLLEQPYMTRATGESQGQRFPFTLPKVGGSANQNVNFAAFEPISGSPGYSINNRVPYSEDYNFTIQRAIGTTTVVSVGYLGTQGHRLIGETEANPGNTALCLSLMGTGVMAGTPQCGRYGEESVYTRPDGSIVNGTRTVLGPDFGSNQYSGNFASSAYNSLQATVQRKARDMTFLAAYTYSKSMDDASGYTDDWSDFENFRKSRSLSAFDITHNFVINYAYMVPFDRAFQSLPKRLTQGWSINGITRFATGNPVTIEQGGDYSLTGTYGVDEPNYSGGLTTRRNPRGAGADGVPFEYFNVKSFSSETLGVVGDANRRFFHGPGWNNWDLGLHKDTKLRENLSVQFRAEFFSAFNHPQFYAPSGYFTNTTSNPSRMGIITGAGGSRVGQLAMKFIF
jgi:hypothetical protein